MGGWAAEDIGNRRKRPVLAARRGMIAYIELKDVSHLFFTAHPLHSTDIEVIGHLLSEDDCILDRPHQN